MKDVLSSLRYLFNALYIRFRSDVGWQHAGSRQSMFRSASVNNQWRSGEGGVIQPSRAVSRSGRRLRNQGRHIFSRSKSFDSRQSWLDLTMVRSDSRSMLSQCADQIDRRSKRSHARQARRRRLAAMSLANRAISTLQSIRLREPENTLER